MDEDRFSNVIKTSDGYVVVGYSRSPNGDLNDLNKRYYDAIIVKYDLDGNL